MEFVEKKPPRNFQVGINKEITIQDCGSIKLGNNWASWRIEFDPFPTLIIDKSYQ